jgi:DNA-binding response OmpR family regulator
LHFGNLAIDAISRSVTKDGRRIRLTWAEFELLWFLAMNNGQVVSRDELFKRLVDVEYNGLDRTIDVRVSRLRRKLEPDPSAPQIIQSVRSVGYCFTINQEPEPSGEI